MPETSRTAARPSRRSVLGAAAWSAPVVLVATAAPAMAASGSRVLRIRRFGGLVNSTSTGGTFAHDYDNEGPGTTAALRATLTITAASADRWGAAPTATASGSATWTLQSVTGSGDTRTFTFAASQQRPVANGYTFDVTVTSDGGDLAPGTRSATVSDAPASASYGPESFTSSGGRGLRPAPRGL